MNKKGFTLLEVVVAMGIFTILSTIIIGAYISVIKIKTMSSSTYRNVQNVRMITERVARLSRQAEKGSGGGDKIELYFNIKSPSEKSGVMFYFDAAQEAIMYKTCQTFNATINKCQPDGWNEPFSLSPNTKITSASFTINAVIPPSLSFSITSSKNPGAWDKFEQTNFSLNTKIVLESIK